MQQPCSDYKYILVGGGLFNGLLAHGLKIRGENSFCIIESQPVLGGSHTWSYFTDDSGTNDSRTAFATGFNSAEYRFLQDIRRQSWPYYEVLFPEYSRRLETTYNSIRSEDFHNGLMNFLNPSQYRLNTPIDRIEWADPHALAAQKKPKVRLQNGEVLSAEIIFDSRPPESSDLGFCAYQNFYGLDVRFSEPHGIHQPIIMDARVAQKDSYRFFYLLPWSEHEVLVEDTRFEMGGIRNISDWRSEVEKYISSISSARFEVRREEVGSLPLPLTDKILNFTNKDRVLDVGLRGGFFHPTTGYSLPITCRAISHMLSAGTEPETVLQQYKQARQEWKNRCGFLLKLNRMLYGAAVGDERRNIFAQFYKNSGSIIKRFYQGQLHLSDPMRILFDKPPVPITKAVKSLTTKQWMEEWTN